MINEFYSDSEEDCHGFGIPPDMESVFKKPFYLAQEEAIMSNTRKKHYIMHLSATTQGLETRLALSMSNCMTYVYSLGTSLTCTTTLPSDGKSIINVRFAADNDSLLYVGYGKGTIKLWDLRDTKQCALEFKDTSKPKSKGLHKKIFSSFDVNCEGRFVCAGTEVTDGDAFLMFWDTRQASLLGGYWESHTDVVTQVRFHPKEKDYLISGSTDGLINLYDLSQSEEDDALLQSFNTGSSVEKVDWHEGTTMTVSCVTHTADIQFWHLDDSSAYQTFSRTDIASVLQTVDENLEDCLYVADVHSTSEPGSYLVLAGSHMGGLCLRSAIVSSDKLSPLSYFDGNKQIVRCSWFDPETEVLVTGGEGALLSIWKCDKIDSTANSYQLKATHKLKEKQNKAKWKPY